MKLTMRQYKGDTDYWEIRNFLCRNFLAGSQVGWHVAKFDYWLCHINQSVIRLPLHRSVFLWHTGDGQVVGVVHPEVVGEAHLHVDAQWRTPELEEEMLDVAEQFLAIPGLRRRRRVRVWVRQGDWMRQHHLLRRGYRALDGEIHLWHRSLCEGVSLFPPPKGYVLRSLAGCEEWPERCFLSWKAFHPDDSYDHHRGSPAGWQWYHNIQNSPLYRQELDILAVAESGRMVGFGTVWFDAKTHSGLFEPVGVDPAHQRRGLGKAIMSEGLRRLLDLGAHTACLCSYCTPDAHHLYATVGFTVCATLTRWEKEF